MSAEVRAGDPLPLRNSRRRPSGRHRSPDRLSVPPNAPALVVAVPGFACAESDDISAEVAASAGASCPGVDVRVGYLEGEKANLATVLAALRPTVEAMPSAVVVPLMTSPDPRAGAVLSKAVAEAGVAVLLTGHLAPHPLLAEALHARLAEAGLARAGRTGALSISSAAGGVLLGAVGGEQALQEAGIVAVLLASRLAVPVVPALLSDAASLDEATERLHEARAASLALAPCFIGPEIDPTALAAAAAQTGARHAAPLGAHPAIGQLVAIRYGAALQDPRIALR
ncbi:MAG: sirohydrochlorin chelatase [Micromonosporaceae bacterium]